MQISRDYIGIFGKMNAGKSSIINLLTQQETSIVDKKAGTTADAKITLQEIHGLGPVKLFDTAGINESDILGEKKRKKVISTLKECDLILLVIDPSTKQFASENEIIKYTREHDKQLLIIFNIFDDNDLAFIKKLNKKIDYFQFYPSIKISAINKNHRQRFLNFILNKYITKNIKIELLPFIEANEFYILNIPMDEETPEGRYLRPQAMCEEYITRNWAYPISYRMNLTKARQDDPEEKKRFENFISNFNKRPKCIITDSQAMDIMKDWTPDDIMLTTFSIMMINYVSNGKLNKFVDGIKALETMESGNKILITEACNHSRIKEDIGTVQIPRYINEHFPHVKIDHNFGREFQDNEKLSIYKLMIHCGGCMISQQKLLARLRDLDSLGTPYTNYGIFLSYIQGEKVLERVLVPWKKSIKLE